MKKPAIYALTKKGARLARKIAQELGGDVFVHKRCGARQGEKEFEDLGQVIKGAFFQYSAHVFVAAAGIVVRTIAPLISSKDKDPAILVLDHNGRFCISLLSGHLGGANDLARRVASITGGQAVITTATDTEGIVAIDILAKAKGLAIENISALKYISGAALGGDPVQVYDPEGRLGTLDEQEMGFKIVPIGNLAKLQPSFPSIVVTWKQVPHMTNRLILHPKCLVAGVGCNRDTPSEEIIGLINRVFEENRLAMSSLSALASINAKQDERGLLDAAERLKARVLFFSKDHLNNIEVKNPSTIVKFHMGVEGVCEPAAILGAGKGRLIVPKTKSKNVTVAVALEP